MKAFLALAVVGTLVSAPFQVQAKAELWGAHDALELGFNNPAASTNPFADTFEFSVNDGATLRSVAVANNLPSVLNLANGFVQLFKSQTGADAMIGMFGFSGTTGDADHSFASLVAGDYYYLVTGLANGPLGGSYLLSSTTVPAVPEPTQLSLFLAGLLAAGVVLRRRRAN